MQHAVCAHLARADGRDVVAEGGRHASLVLDAQVLRLIARRVVHIEREHVVLRGEGVLHHVARHLDLLVGILPVRHVGNRYRLRRRTAPDDGQDNDQHDDDDAGDHHEPPLRFRVHARLLLKSLTINCHVPQSSEERKHGEFKDSPCCRGFSPFGTVQTSANHAARFAVSVRRAFEEGARPSKTLEAGSLFVMRLRPKTPLCAGEPYAALSLLACWYVSQPSGT